MNNITLKKSDIRRIIKEETRKILLETNTATDELREAGEQALNSLEEHQKLIGELHYASQNVDGNSDTAINAMKSLTAYIKDLEILLESLR